MIDDTDREEQMVREKITEVLLVLDKAETSIIVLRNVAQLLKCVCADGNEKFTNTSIRKIISALYTLIKQSDDAILTDTVTTVNYIIRNYRDCPENMQFFINNNILVDLISLLSHGDAKIQEIVLRSIFDIITISNEYIRAVLAQNPLSHFPMLLTHLTHKIRLDASWCLSVIIDRSPSQVQVLIDLSLMPLVIANLGHEDSEVQISSAKIIFNITKRGTKEQIKELFCSDVTIERFFDELQQCHWRALSLMLEGIINILKIYCVDMPSSKIFKQIIPIIFDLIHNIDDEIIKKTLLVMKFFIDGQEEQIQLLNENGIVPILVSFLSHNEVILLKASICLIGNIVLGSDNQIEFVLNNKLLSKFPKLLSQNDADIVDKSLFILNKINESGNRTKSIIDAGLLELIVEKFKHDEFRIKKKSTFVISNLTLNASKEQMTVFLNAGALHPFLNMAKCHDAETIHTVLNGKMNIMSTYHNEPPMPKQISEQINLTLQHLIHQTDDNILERTAWALSYFLDGGDENIQLVINSGIVSRLIELLENLEESLKIATLHILCKIVSYAIEYQLVLDFGVSTKLSSLIRHPLDEIREVSLTILSNLTYGAQKHANFVMDEVSLSNIIDNLMTGKIEIKKSVIIVFNNLIRYLQKDQIMQLLQTGVFSKFIQMMACDDTEIVELVFSSITRIIKILQDQLANNVNQDFQEIIDGGFLSQSIELLSHFDWKVQLAALRAIYEIGSLSTDGQVFIDNKLLSEFHLLLNPAFTKKEIRYNALLFLLRIVRISQQHCKAVIDAELTHSVIQNLDKNNIDIDGVATLLSIELKLNKASREKIERIIQSGTISTFCEKIQPCDHRNNTVAELLEQSHLFGTDLIKHREFEFSEWLKTIYEELSDISIVETILKIVSCAKPYIIFLLEHENKIDINFFENERNHEQIIITLGNIISEGDRNRFIGLIIHEFCHFAVYETFCNGYNAYFSNDEEYKRQWKIALDDCFNMRENEAIIRKVFEDYPENSRLTELVARYFQFQVEYYKDFDKLKEFEKKYPTLCEICEKYVSMNFQAEFEIIQAIREINREILHCCDDSNFKIQAAERKNIPKLPVISIFSHSKIEFVKSNNTALLANHIFFNYNKDKNFRSKFVFLKFDYVIKAENFAKFKKAIKRKTSVIFIIESNGNDLGELQVDEIIQQDKSRLHFLVLIDENQPYETDYGIHFNPSHLSEAFVNAIKINFQNRCDMPLTKLISVEDFKNFKVLPCENMLNGSVSVGNQMKRVPRGFIVEREYFQTIQDDDGWNVIEKIDDFFKSDSKVLISNKSGAENSIKAVEMYYHLKEKYNDNWIIYTNLVKLTEMFKEGIDYLHENIDKCKLLFFRKIFELNAFEAEIFNILAKSGRVILVIDSSDEVSSFHCKLVKYLIDMLFLNFPHQRLMLFTRPHLENHFNEFTKIELEMDEKSGLEMISA